MDPTTNIMEQSLWEADNMVLLLKNSPNLMEPKGHYGMHSNPLMQNETYEPCTFVTVFAFKLSLFS